MTSTLSIGARSGCEALQSRQTCATGSAGARRPLPTERFDQRSKDDQSRDAVAVLDIVHIEAGLASDADLEAAATHHMGLQELARRAGTWAALDEQGIGYVPFEPWPLPDAMLRELERERASGQVAARARPPGGAPSLRRYILHNYAALLTAPERIVYKNILLAQKSTAHSKWSEEASASADRLSSEMAGALASGPEPFLEAVAAEFFASMPETCS